MIQTHNSKIITEHYIGLEGKASFDNMFIAMLNDAILLMCTRKS
jgi:hypothetical protein